MLGNYKKLIVWQKSILLVKKTYKITSDFPREETFGIISQLRRACISIPANIAEGYSRFSKKDYCRFLKISFSSAAEVETLLFISQELNFINSIDFSEIEELLTEIKKMLNVKRSYK